MINIEYAHAFFGSKAPYKEHSADAAYDLSAAKITRLHNGIIEFDTGLIINIPRGYLGFIMLRGSSWLYPLIITNSIGLIDAEYTGTIRFRCRRTDGFVGAVKRYVRTLFGFPDKTLYEIGDRIGQILILPVVDVNYVEIAKETMPTTARGEKGFCSTGMK